MVKNSSLQAKCLVDYLLSLDDFILSKRDYECYQHMGAILTDTILQAGLNYKTVVAPRVKRVIEQYPNAYTASNFLSIIESEGAKNVLNWQHSEKPRRLEDFTRFLVQQSIDDSQDLYDWLLVPSKSQSLLGLRGIGPKTIDYLKNLVNIPTVAVDRHIRKFVHSAGIFCDGYDEVKNVVKLAADLLSITSSSLDHDIWLYMSNKT